MNSLPRLLRPRVVARFSHNDRTDKEDGMSDERMRL